MRRWWGGGADAAIDSAGIGPGGSSSAATIGDTNLAGVSSGGTGSTSVGSVTGFGSTYLNGNDVRIDDGTVAVTDEEGNDKKGTLKLGMRVTVTSTMATNGDVTAQSTCALVKGVLRSAEVGILDVVAAKGEGASRRPGLG